MRQQGLIWKKAKEYKNGNRFGIRGIYTAQ